LITPTFPPFETTGTRKAGRWAFGHQRPNYVVWKRAMSNPNEGQPSERPICVSVIVCNEIIEDKRTNNKTLVSLFNTIMLPQAPGSHPRMFVMASLTDGRGHWPISFVIRAPSGAEVMRFNAEAQFHDPLAVTDISVEIQGLVFPEAGVYFVDVMAGASLLGHRRIMVNVAQPQPSQTP
jgi:hypothetical protein